MRIAAATGLALVAVAAMTPVTAAQKGTVANYTLADSVTFRDASTDGILSDGASYLNAIDGTIKIFTGGSGDLTMSLSGSRTMQALTLSPSRILGSPYPTAPTPATALGVVNIWSIPSGATVTRSAAFGHATGNISFGDHNDGAGAYSTQVNVTRVSKTEWIVSTDGTDAQAVYSTQVKRKNTFTAEYILPFQIDVVCSACANK